MATGIFDALTPVQREAVEHIDGPLLMLAGPGSGKTRVVTHRIAYLVDRGVNPGMILALTFTNKAADEMKERVRRLVPDAHVWIGTFHRFCSRLLRRHADHVGLQSNFTIYDSSDSRQALKRAIESLKLPTKMTTPERLGNQISWLKNRLITAEDYVPREGSELGPILKDVYPAYQRELLAANAVDFDDLLLHVVTLLQQSPEIRASLDEVYRYVMVDEYQDTNLAQYAIVRGLCNDYPNLAVTGDPDQSIYGWRGANLNNILDFETDYPDVRVVRLEQNYRSTPNILRVAQALISNNMRRKNKDLFTDNAEGLPVRLVTYATHKDEADEIVASIAVQMHDGKLRPRDVAVFYRVNALSRALEHALREHGIPYQIVHGVEFYQRKEIKDVLAYFHLIYNPQDNNALRRIINVPPRRIGKTTVVRLADDARAKGISVLEAARNCDAIETLSKPARPRLKAFAELIDSLSGRAGDSVEEILGLIVTESGYLSALRDSDAPEDLDRAANVEELLAAAGEFDAQYEDDNPLGAFLEQASLVNDVDDWDEETDRVTLMTLHAAKGLEFPVVFIIGVEQGLLPHERSMHLPEQEEEERRLLFVGITRAKQQLQLSRALIRAHRGGISHTIPSQFLVELPRAEMELVDCSCRPVVRTYEEHTYEEQSAHEESTHGESAHEESTHEEDWDEIQAGSVDDISVDDMPCPSQPESKPVVARIDAAKVLRTADQLMGSDADGPPDAGTSSVVGADSDAPRPAPIDPVHFQIGMAVVHPEYGPGKIFALSGSGKDRTGTINFVTVGQKKFILAQSKVRPTR